MANEEPSGEPDRWADVVPFPTERRAVPLRELVGDVLREERHRQERTLADVADEAAVSLQYLSEVERGRKDVSSDVLTAIHEALGLELSDVLERATRRLHLGSQRGKGFRMLAA
jgi:transcriptional regulator with XRE-family HTH domain